MEDIFIGPNEKEKYINPFTDYGFKRLFGEEINKDLLMDFLNELLRDEVGTITELTYLKNELLGSKIIDRGAIFDIYCKNEKGESFIVELQKAKQDFFKDRTVFYSTFPIREQAQKGTWNYKLNAVFTVGILDFVFEDDKKDTNKYRYDVKLCDIETHKVFYDKLTFIYLEMPKFNKPISELKTKFDKWLYVLRNLYRLNNLPDSMRERVFEKVFEVAEIAKFTASEELTYEASLMHYRDMNNVIDTAFSDGEIKGKAEGKAEGKYEEKRTIAINALKMNIDNKIIEQITGLSQLEIEDIRNEIKE